MSDVTGAFAFLGAVEVILAHPLSGEDSDDLIRKIRKAYLEYVPESTRYVCDHGYTALNSAHPEWVGQVAE